MKNNEKDIQELIDLLQFNKANKKDMTKQIFEMASKMGNLADNIARIDVKDEVIYSKLKGLSKNN